MKFFGVVLMLMSSLAAYAECESHLLPRGVEHGPFSSIPWLKHQKSNPFQASIWRALSQPGGVIHQKDSGLGYRGLLVPFGGLCASTCGVNMMSGLRKYYGMPEVFPSLQDELHYSVNYLAFHFGVDARRGLAFTHLTLLLRHLIEVSGLASAVGVYHWYVGPHYTPIQNLFPDFSNSVPIIGVKGFDSLGRPVMYHAMMATAFSVATGEITLLDPELPWNPIYARLIFHAQSGMWQMQIDHSAYPATNAYFLTDVLEIRSLY